MEARLGAEQWMDGREQVYSMECTNLMGENRRYSGSLGDVI